MLRLLHLSSQNILQKRRGRHSWAGARSLHATSEANADAGRFAAINKANVVGAKPLIEQRVQLFGWASWAGEASGGRWPDAVAGAASKRSRLSLSSARGAQLLRPVGHSLPAATSCGSPTTGVSSTKPSGSSIGTSAAWCAAPTRDR